MPITAPSELAPSLNIAEQSIIIDNICCSGSGPELEYRVLATDYETFTIEYTCQDNALIKRRGSKFLPKN